jgi:Fur family ferric uptake transcriptional regulator
MPGVFSAEELLASARVVEPRIGIATVYRALTAMTDSGYIEQVDARDGAALYARCRSVGHHHHLVCTSCGRVEEAECHLDDMIERLRATRGFVVTAHDLNLSGLCAECVDNRGVA